MAMEMKSGAERAVGEDVEVSANDAVHRIGDLAKRFGVSLRTLRFYEDKGLMAPKRVGTTRLYSEKDAKRLDLIMLGRRVGFSLRDVKQMLDLYDSQGNNVRQLRFTLERSEKQLTRLNKQRQTLDASIQELSEMMTTVKRKLADATAARLVS